MSDGALDFDTDELNDFVKNRNVCYKDYKTGEYYKIISFERPEDREIDLNNKIDLVIRHKVKIDPITGEQTGSTISETFNG
jgi:hypothetical protein